MYINSILVCTKYYELCAGVSEIFWSLSSVILNITNSLVWFGSVFILNRTISTPSGHYDLFLKFFSQNIFSHLVK